MDNGHEVFTPQEAADYLRIHTRTLRRLVKARKIKGVKVGGQFRFHRVMLEKFMGVPAQKGNNV